MMTLGYTSKPVICNFWRQREGMNIPEKTYVETKLACGFRLSQSSYL